MTKLGWITFHRWVFEDSQTPDSLNHAKPRQAAVWLQGADSPLTRNGFRTGHGHLWAGLGFFADRKGADGLLDNLAGEFPDLPPCSEEFHCLLRPIRCLGETHWLQGTDAEIGIATQDPGGPIAVLTSAGYDDLGPAQHARMRDFGENVDKVRAWYDTLEANIVNGVYATAPDGLTFSLWRSDKALMSAAYGDGVHRTLVDRQKAEKMADRTSYTRARVLRHMGTWDGRDPVAETE